MIVKVSKGGARRWLLQCFQAGIHAVRGDRLVCQALSDMEVESLRLIAIGKAAGAMVEGAFTAMDDKIIDALVISKTGHLDMLPSDARMTVIEAGHPLPDQNSLFAGAVLIERLSSGNEDDQWLLLLSGGASSLVEQLAEGYTLEDLQRLNEWLLASGLDIQAMNAIRQRVSGIKGGLANGYLSGKAEVWAISDVPGDDPAVIGSGLFYQPTPLNAGSNLPDWVRDWMQQTAQCFTAPPGEPPRHRILGNLDLMLDAIGVFARESIDHVVRMNTHFAGDAEPLGRQLAEAIINGPPGLTIWGGESTVTLPVNPGQGGRNQQLALSAATVLAGHADCYLLAMGTDGSDGPTDAAGALVDGGTVQRAREEGFDVPQILRTANAYSCLAETGDLIETGPTGTNVTDIVLGYKVPT